MSVTDIGNRLSQQFLLSVLRDRLDETQRQSTTGKKSSTIAGMGHNAASASITYRNQNNLIETYKNNLSIAKTRFSVTDNAILSITESARDVVTQLRAQLQGAPPQATILSDHAKMQIQSVADKLNTQVDGVYVFSGTAAYSPSFTNTANLMTSVGTVVSAALTDPATSVAGVVADAGALNKSSLGFSNSAIYSAITTFRADSQTDLQYTIKGGDDGFADIMRGMAIVANLPQPTTAQEQDNYWHMVNAAIELIEGGTRQVEIYQARMGGQARIVDDLLAQHRDTQTAIEEYVGEVEDVDMAEAAMKLSNLKTQMETSYNIIAALKNLSLVNYI